MKKYAVKLFVGFGLMVTAILTVFSSTANAAVQMGGGTRTERCGYFTNVCLATSESGTKVFEDGLNANNLSELKSYVRSHLNGSVVSGGTNAQEQAGAAFIILTMLGYAPFNDANTANGINTANARLTDWENLVTQYSNNGWIEWNVAVSGTNMANTFWMNDNAGGSNVSDVGGYYSNVSNAASIRFNSPDGSKYIIKRDCANPIGQISGLNPNTTGTIAGFKVDQNGSQSSGVSGAPIRYDCCSSPPSGPGNGATNSGNPYSWSNLAIGEHQISAPTSYNGYTLTKYDLCYRGGNCYSGSSNVVTVDLRNGAIADLWWHYSNGSTGGSNSNGSTGSITSSCSAGVSGTVRDSDWGGPWVGDLYYGAYPGGTFWRSVTTDSSGNFSIPYNELPGFFDGGDIIVVLHTIDLNSSGNRSSDDFGQTHQTTVGGRMQGCDKPATISGVPDCVAQNIIVNIRDDDWLSTRAATTHTQVVYSGFSGGTYPFTNTYVNSNTRSYVAIDMSGSGANRYEPQIVSLSTGGITSAGQNASSYHEYNGSVSYGRPGGGGCAPRDFSLVGSATTTLDSKDNPTQVTFSSGATVSYPNASTQGGSGSSIALTGTVVYEIYNAGSNPGQTPDLARRLASLGSRSINGTYSGTAITFPGNTYNDNSSSPNYSLAFANNRAPGNWVCAYLTINQKQGTVYDNGEIATSTGQERAYDCKQITNLPYLKAYGADVMAGGGFRSGASCPATPSDIKISYNWGFGVASTTHAAIATGEVTGLVSAALNPTTSSTGFNPLATQFTFGRTTSPNGHYPLAAGQGCLSDFFSLKGTTQSITDGADLRTKLTGAQDTSGSNNATGFNRYESAGSITIGSGFSLPPGRRAVVFVNGTLTINGAIAYTTPNTRTDVDDIQALFIVARHIDIHSSVDQLNGVYIAQPSGTAGEDGIINTCSNGGGSGWFGACDEQLTVYGSFIAKSIKFWRTFGTLKNANSYGFTESATTAAHACTISGGGTSSQSICAAEVFRFSPDMYLTGTPFTGGGGGGGTIYDTYAELPPNL